MIRSFEQGPIRPPSEARSLLVRVIRNCTWNRCTFCPVYKGSTSSLRSVDEVIADVDAMAKTAALVAGDATAGAGVPAGGFAALPSGDLPPEAHQVALFVGDGARNVFLQDADPCAVAPAKLAAIIGHIRQRFPTVERVTTYGRAATLARRTPAQLKGLADAGLTRVHLGLESGSDEVLATVCKGCTAAQLVTAGTRVLEAGMEFCFYVMPGLGGRALATTHVRGTAAVLRAVAPHAPADRPLVVRLRTTAVVPGTPLAACADAGEFDLPDDVEVAREVRDLLVALGDARLDLRSDHALNLLAELQGSLPADSGRLLALLDEFLELDADERAEFALGSRLGVYRTLADRRDEQRRALLRSHVPDVARASAAELLEAAKQIRARFL
jgi:hypothetical protein